MTTIRMINTTKSTAPKDAATIITAEEGLLLSFMRTSFVDFTVVGVKKFVEDPGFKASIPQSF